jgi:cytochrome P450
MNQVPKQSFENCQFELSKEPSSGNWVTSLIALFFSLPRRIYTTFLLIKHGELLEPAAKTRCPFKVFNSYFSLFFSFQTTTVPGLMKAILKHPRKDPENGFFDDQETKKAWLLMVRDIFPQDGVQEDDLIMTCLKEHHAKYRQPIMQFIGPNSMKKHGNALKAVAEMTLDEYVGDLQTINGTELTFTYTTSIISSLLLGHPGPFSAYRDISIALNCLNRGVIKKNWHQSFSKEEKESYEHALETMRHAIDLAMANTEETQFGSFVKTLQEKLNPLQTKVSLFVMYFAGSETSAALLNYLLWQLGRHPEYQEAIYREVAEGDLLEVAESSQTLQRIFVESIRLFSAAVIIPRRTAADLVCRGKDQQGNVVFEKSFKKNEVLAPSPSFAGRDPLRFEDPEKFQPERFSEIPKVLDWIPFGDGPHTCPGQWLAKSEIAIFTTLLIRRFRFSSFPVQEPKQQAYMTIKLAEETSLHLTKR